MQFPIESKLPYTGTTIFTEMSALAVQYKAVNLGQGFPDFEMDGDLIRLVAEAMQKGHNQYAHMYGLFLLRERICEKINRIYGATINPDTEITITPGATYAIYTALTCVLRPGDEVIVFEPVYDSYIPNIEINGAIPVRIPLSYPEYKIDWELVKTKLSPKTRMIMLNTPHNPTGAILSEEDMRQLQRLLKDTDVLLLSDEVYEHLVFDGRRHESVLRYPDLLQRSFVCFSFGKIYHCTGWKTGYCIAPPALMQEFRKVHQFNSFSSNTPVQYALAEFLQKEEHYLELGKLIQQKRDYFQVLMQQTRFKALPSSGSYFQLYSYEAISDDPEKTFAIRLVKEAGVATIPVSAFYQDAISHQVLRFCLAKKSETLEEAVNRLVQANF